jgi:hypothetical protein
MKRLKFALYLLVALPLLGGAALAGMNATPDEAKAMALRAADFLRENGPEKAFPVFNDPEGPFHDRDLYVFVHDGAGTNVAHGFKPELIGQNVMDLTDPDGKLYVREFFAVQDEGWVDYKYESPLTHETVEKTSYIVRVDQYVVGVGAYKY